MTARDHAKREKVHNLRVKIKQLRARARILQFLGRPIAKPVERKLKSIARILSPVRDRDVEIAWLIKHKYQPLKGLKPSIPLLSLEPALAKLSQKVSAALAGRAIDEAAKNKALRICKNKALHAWKKAEETKRIKDFHEWRKRTKDLQYQMEFLGQVRQAKAVKKLAQALGNAQDGALMQELLKRKPQIAPKSGKQMAKKEAKFSREQALRLAKKALKDK
ncbi:MAG: CHAD domain-containing protein [Bdellovibrionota bacterium]